MKWRFKMNTCDQGHLKGTGVFWFSNYKEYRRWSALISSLSVLCQSWCLSGGVTHNDFWCLQRFFCMLQNKAWGTVSTEKKEQKHRYDESRAGEKLTRILWIINMDVLLPFSLRLHLQRCYRANSKKYETWKGSEYAQWWSYWICSIILL